MIRLERKDFLPADTFECGQCFRWYQNEDGSYSGIAGEYPANISIDEKNIYIDGAGDEAFWINYLDMKRDYEGIKEELSNRDEKIRDCIDAGAGIHILNQDRWETIVSFIISQNNNISRIRKCIENLSDNFGEYAGEAGGRKFNKVPDKEVLAGLSVSDLAPVRLGYRAKYLIDTARADFDPYDDLTYDDIIALPGVGPKVASCIMLFAYGDFASFPIDVWVKRVMHDVYGFDESDTRGMKRFAKESFGDNGGIAQQYLFHYVRNIKNIT